MSDAATSTDSRWTDALLATALFAVDPQGLVGVVVAAQAGPVRETWLEFSRSLLPVAVPFRRLPAYIPDSRLLGGLDLIATLNSGKPVVERGVLAEADQGVVLLPMAERLSPALIGRLVAVLDSGVVTLERDGLALRLPARLAVIACNEAQGDDPPPASALLDRLALQVDLDGLRFDVDTAGWPGREEIQRAQANLSRVEVAAEMLEALCAAALALGVHSGRAPILALRVARASAALAGRDAVTVEDVSIAARLVLAARATRLPMQQSETESAAAEPQPAPPELNAQQQPAAAPDAQTNENEAPGEMGELKDQVIDSARAAIPAGLLATLMAAGTVDTSAQSSGRAGVFRSSMRRGRPAGVRKGLPRAGVPLNVVETLRAAAPWQRLRQQHAARMRTDTARRARIDVRAEDFHITRFRQRTETTTVFVLDASGSTALQRLGEAKGAVELLLADCYVRRDQVAVLAFRGRTAEVLLPPTRSLVRARRSLGSLPGGGGTPLAAAIDAATALAEGLRRRGSSPTIVLLTDGRGNVARDGRTGRGVAEQDALQAAARMKHGRLAALLIDTSTRPQEQAQRLAAAMGARYVPLPHASSAALARAVQGAQSSAAR